MYTRVLSRCVECECVMMVHSSVSLYLFFVDASVFEGFVSCCDGPLGGWCRRRLIVVLVDCSFAKPGGHVRSVGRGFF